jgi:hypothetical protein
MKRVTEIKVLPAKDTFILDGMLARLSRGARKNKGVKALFLAGAILFLMSMSGCGKSESTENTPTTEAPIESPYVPETTLEVTSEPVADSTPEPTATIDPVVLEEARIENVAKAYYERLAANPGYPNDYEKVLEFTKRFNGNFDSLPNLEGLDDETRQTVKIQYYNEMVDFMIDYINTMINNVVAEMFDGKKSESPNPETVLIYNNQNEDVVGFDTLKLIEDLGIKARQSISDKDAFKENANEFQTLIATLYLESGSSYNGVKITSINNMNKRLETIARIEAQGFMAVIQIASQVYGEKISTTVIGSEKCYSTEDIVSVLAGSLDCNVNSWALDATTEILIEMDIYQGTKQQALTHKP